MYSRDITILIVLATVHGLYDCALVSVVFLSVYYGPYSS